MYMYVIFFFFKQKTAYAMRISAGVSVCSSDLAKALTDMLADETAELETATRSRIEGALRGLLRRKLTLEAWRSMLLDLETGTPDAFVDWFALDRIEGRDFDQIGRAHV